MADRLDALLAAERFVIVDGGLATELEARGCDLADPLWSAKVLLEQPALLREVHRAWLDAGAEIITTASYQATLPGLRARGCSELEARALLRDAVALARSVTEGREALVAASIGSYGAYLADGSEFRGDYPLAVAELVEFHRERLLELCAAGPDLLAFETIPAAREALAIAELLTNTAGPRAWVSFSLRSDVDGEPEISDGTRLREAVQPLLGHPRVAAIGVNCVSPTAVLPAIETLARVAPGLPIIAYPNAGERWIDRGWVGAPTELEQFTALAERWSRAGARLIGGCCRTRPKHIQALLRLRERLE
ncbi:MAG TPA: homocysteine S-methyltransferase [Enhygromyxa sp.]|nr:homocysteine S-methyltransferase [Enhygromyxa sp.]